MRATSLAFMSFLLLLAGAGSSSAQEACNRVANTKVMADDGQYLGTIASKNASDSIFNAYGPYGGKYSANSIWNDYGHYGGKYSNFSAFNPYAAKPPQIVKDKKTIARLTVNKSVKGAVSPYFLKTCSFY
ncbi:MAG: hypothetical protein ABUL48_01735 [Pseudorhodoplanes sp.]